MYLAEVKASSVLRCISKSITKSRDMIIPLHSALVRPHLEKCSAFIPKFTRHMKKIERVQWRATKIVTELENLTYKEILVELSLFCLEDRGFRGKLITFHQYIKYIYKKHGGALFTRKHGDKTMGTS